MSEYEVEKVIDGLKNNTSTGHDEINVIALKFISKWLNEYMEWNKTTCRNKTNNNPSQGGSEASTNQGGGKASITY